MISSISLVFEAAYMPMDTPETRILHYWISQQLTADVLTKPTVEENSPSTRSYLQTAITTRFPTEYHLTDYQNGVRIWSW